MMNVQAALGWTDSYHLCGDIDLSAVRRTVCNFASVSSRHDAFHQ